MLNKLSKLQVQRIIKNIKIKGFHVQRQLIKKKIVIKLLKKVISEHKILNLKTSKYKGLRKRDSKDLRLYNLPNVDKIFIDLISQKEIEKILITFLNDPHYRFLDKKKPNYICSGFNARSSGYKLDLHIDSYIPFVGERTNSVLILFVLEDMNEKNGATIVVPGSHQSGTYTNRSLKKFKIINAKQGDVLIMDGRTWHGTTENNSGKSRWLINGLFTPWWIKQQMNFPNSLTDKIYNKLNQKQKLLMGYCSIPPSDQFERLNVKCGYEVLKKFKK